MIAFDALARVERLHLASGKTTSAANHHPSPPAVEEVKQEGIVSRQREADPCARRCLGTAGHSSAASCSTHSRRWPPTHGTKQQLDEQDRRRDQLAARVRRQGGFRGPGELPRSSAVQISAAMMNNASKRCADRREMVTSVPVDQARHDHISREGLVPRGSSPARSASSHSQRGSRASREPGEWQHEGEAISSPISRWDPFQKKMNLYWGEIHARRPLISRYSGVALLIVRRSVAMFVG